MLELLKINNVALIKNLEISFSRGFNVILGETGAGKSIIIDALNFVLGSKADKTLIRNGEETMKVTAKFTSINDKVQNLLRQLEIQFEEEILLTRTYSEAGKGDARINGEIVTVNTLREVGTALVDTYSQNESVSLLKQKNHLSILDSYKPFELAEIKAKIETQLLEINDINRQIKSLGGSQENRSRQIDILKYQISEIESAGIQPNEDEELNLTLSKLSHSEKIVTALSAANQFLNDEEASVLNLLRSAYRTLTSVEIYDENIANVCSAINDALLELDDVNESIFKLGEEYNFDENSLAKLMERREKLDNLKKKYGGSLEKVLIFLNDAKNELDKIEHTEELLEKAQNEKNILLKNVSKDLKILGSIRRRHAEEIEGKIVNGLRELGILKAQFKVHFFELAGSIFELENYSLNCMEDVEFLFSANFGEDLKPLAKTISGGEMSRFMLAFKNVIAEIGGAETLIFDEIDAGISGKIANSVALKIAKLSKNYQILCITHLPQVAAMGDSFYLVSKAQSGDRTETYVTMLDGNRIAEEIALLAYGTLDENRVSLAKEMLLQNKQAKSNI